MKRVLSSVVSSSALFVLAWATPALAQPTTPADSTASPPAKEQERESEPQAAVVVAAPPSSPGMTTMPEDRAGAEGPARHDLIRVNAGLRIGYVPSRAFDMFASNNALPQFSIDGTYPVLTSGKLVLAAGLGWDVGGRSDKVRGFDASLTTHRLYVPIEGRWYFTPGLSVFGKVSPGAVAAISSVRESSSPNELSGTGWAFSADLSIGASILMGPRQRMDKRAVRFWVTPELGYAFTTQASLRTNPGRDEKDLLGSDENTNLRSLALSGFFWRASLGTTF
jgi:hypothetical protein